MARVTSQNEIQNLDHAPIEQSLDAADAMPTLWGRLLGFLSGPYLTLVSRFVLGGIFFLAGLSKLGVPKAMAANIESYEMNLPGGLVQFMAVVLPPLEIGLGVWLIAGLFTRFSAGVTGGLLVVFLIGIVQAAVRGLDINCGCFGGPESNPLGVAALQALGPVGDFLANEKADIATIVREVVLLLMAVHLILVPTAFSLDSLRRRGRVSEEALQEG